MICSLTRVMKHLIAQALILVLELLSLLSSTLGLRSWRGVSSWRHPWLRGFEPGMEKAVPSLCPGEGDADSKWCGAPWRGARVDADPTLWRNAPHSFQASLLMLGRKLWWICTKVLSEMLRLVSNVSHYLAHFSVSCLPQAITLVVIITAWDRAFLKEGILNPDHFFPSPGPS